MASRGARSCVAAGAALAALLGSSGLGLIGAAAAGARPARPALSGLSLTQSASPATVAAVGDVVTYSFVVRDDAATTVTGLAVAATPGAPVVPAAPPVVATCPVTTLDAGDSTTCTAHYTVTQADLDHGSVADSAVATATGAGDAPVGSAPSTSTVAVDRTATLTVVQSASPTTLAAVGDTVRLSAAVTNTGNVTLHGVRVSDALGTANARTLRPSCPSTVLAPGATTTCSVDRAATQADFDAGALTVTATATGTPPTGAAVTSAPSAVTVTATQHAAVALTMTAAVTDLNGNGVADLDDTIQWAFLVTNTGTVTLDSVTVVDPIAGRVACSAHRLAAGATTACTGSRPYVVGQADVDAGHVDNAATASGHAAATGTTVESDQATTTTPIGTRPALRLVTAGTLQDDGDGRIDAGDRVRWTFQVTNTGNITLDGLVVRDTAGTGVTCADRTLQPAGSTSCVADTPHVLTAADLRAGRVTDTAVATATARGTAVTSLASTGLVTLAHKAGLRVTLAGARTDANADGVADAGDSLRWRSVVSNVGNVTLHGLAVTTGRGVRLACPATTLAPSARMTCVSAARSITAAQSGAGRVTAVVTAAATTPTGSRITSPSAAATVVLQSSTGGAGTQPVTGASSGLVGVGGTGGTTGLASTGPAEVPALLRLAGWSLLLGVLLLAGTRVSGGRRRAAEGPPDICAG